jgi:hypothetical protein
VAPRPLMTERMRRIAPVVATVVAGATLGLLMPTAWARLLVFVVTVITVPVVARRPPRDEADRWYGD